MIKIAKTALNCEREPLKAPFGFKGKFISELWQMVSQLESDRLYQGVGLGVQSILWSDPAVFALFGESKGNTLMMELTRYALKASEGISFDSPIQLMEQLLPVIHNYGKKITGLKNLEKTFALNSLVSIDNAAWLLYCRKAGIHSFDDMLPEEFRQAFAYKNVSLACIPLISYSVPPGEISGMVESGYFFFKIKIGSDPEKDGDLDKMLDWDMKRFTEIHNILKEKETTYTRNGQIPYYLDANGRYDSKDRLLRFLEHADKIGALDRIRLLEEPFPEEYTVDVKDIPVCLAADESTHCDKDAVERIEMGYGAIALKPIAKTVSMSLKIAKAAHDRGVPCFCADLTVNPVLVDWNKNFAARLAPLTGLKTGILEVNGHLNYKNWKTMMTYHPCNGAGWINTDRGLFSLDKDFYESSGGIYRVGDHYAELVNNAVT